MEKNKKVLIGVVLVFVIIITIAIFKILQPAEQPTIEEANIILAESIQNTLGLDSFTTTGDGVFKIKDGEVTLFRVALKDVQISAINPFDFANRDLRGVYTYNFLMDFYAIANFIERMEVPDEDMSAEGRARKTESLREMREMREINFSVTMEMKSIDLDSYIKITKIEGLEEMLYSFAVLEGPVEQPEDIVKKLAKITEKIEPHLGIWYKIPVDPETKEGMKEMGEASAMFKELMKKFAGVIYVEEVFENTKINEVPVYNFARGVDLDKAKNTLIDWVIKEMDIAEAEADKGRTKLAVGWQKIRPIFETIKMDSRTYICQETRFIKKETALTSLNLAELITAIRSAMPEMLIDEDGKVAFDKMKDSFGSINIVMTMNFVYSEHNAVAPILPPAEYEYLEKVIENLIEGLGDEFIRTPMPEPIYFLEPEPYEIVIEKEIKEEEKNNQKKVGIIDKFELDETINVELCRQLITRAQLSEITGYEKDAFTFEKEEVKDAPLGLTRACKIKISEYEEREIVIGFILDSTYKEIYEAFKEKMAEPMMSMIFPKGVEKIEDVGMEAFSLSTLGETVPDVPEIHIILFLDGDTNQVIIISMEKFDYETTLSLAKQVEINLR